MTYSPLTGRKMPPTGTYKGGKKWSARPAGVRINGLNVHHWAGTNLSGLNRLVSSNDPASANYLILTTGELIGSVPEEYRAWTTSAYANDDDKITVEIQNETGAPSWRVSDAAVATLVRLYADLAKRYRFAPTRANLRGHQEYGIATACPGPYLLPRLDDVARKAAALGTTTSPQEDGMAIELDNTQAKQLSETRALVGELKALIADLHSGIAPRIDVPWETPDGKVTTRTADAWLVSKLIQIEKTVGSTSAIEAAVAAGVKKVLDSTPAADEAALTAGVVAEVRKTLEAIEKQTYVLSPEEK